MNNKINSARQLVDKFNRLFYEVKELEENIIHSILITYTTKVNSHNKQSSVVINIDLIRVNIFMYYRDIITNIIKNIRNKKHIYSGFEQNQLHTIYSILAKQIVCDFVTNIKRINEISYIIFVYRKLVDISTFINSNMTINKGSIRAAIKTLGNEFEELFDKDEDGIVYEQKNICDYIDYVLDDDFNLIKTGLVKIDYALSGGIMSNDVFVIAARPGLCKTIFCIDIVVRNVSSLKQENKKCLYFSPDTNVKQIYRRLLKRLKCGDEKDEIIRTLKSFPIVVVDTYWLDEVLEVITTNVNDLGMIIVDYIQTIRIKNDNNSRNEQIGVIISRLKTISRKYGIPLVLVAQINRLYSVMGKQHSPISFIKDSGYIEQEADVVVMIDKTTGSNSEILYDGGESNVCHRDTTNYDNLYKVSVVKNRRGILARSYVRLDGETLSFIEVNESVSY